MRNNYHPLFFFNFNPKIMKANPKTKNNKISQIFCEDIANPANTNIVMTKIAKSSAGIFTFLISNTSSLFNKSL